MLSPEEILAVRNQSNVREIRKVELVAIQELRGDGKSEEAPYRHAVTLWTLDGVKVADLDETTIAGMLEPLATWTGDIRL